MPVKLNSTGGGSVTLTTPSTASDFTLTAPAQTATLITNSSGVLDIGSGQIYKDASGNVGIGTSSPDYKLTIQNSDAAISLKDSGGTTRAYVGVAGVIGTAPTGALRLRSDQGGFSYGYLGTEQMRIDTSANLQFNSGYGSVATAYGCRAWVNFNGTGTVAIRASGNVTSITDNGTGDYTVNFTTAMPDANYSVVGMSCASADGATDTLRGISLWGPTSITTSTARIRTMNGVNSASYDAASAMISVFR